MEFFSPLPSIGEKILAADIVPSLPQVDDYITRMRARVEAAEEQDCPQAVEQWAEKSFRSWADWMKRTSDDGWENDSELLSML